MKKIKIEREVTKEDVFVCVANTSEYDEVCRIITAGGEQILKRPFERLVTYSPLEGYWVAVGSMGDKYQITIPQLVELLGVEYPLKPKFEAGKWYIAERGTNTFCHNGKFDKDDDPCGYGVIYNGEWMEANNIGWGGDYREATPSEVEKALIAEAKRRYRPADKLSMIVQDCAPDSDGRVYPSNPKFGYEGSDRLWLVQGYSYCIFADGKWAEVIEQKQLPTLEELIAEAKSKITVKTESYLCWVEGMREIEAYHIEGIRYPSEKIAIAAYIARKIQGEYL